MEDLTNLRKVVEKIDELVVEAERVNESGKKIGNNLFHTQKKFDELLIDEKNILELSKTLQVQLLKNRDELNNSSEKLKTDVKKILNSIELNFQNYSKQINELENHHLSIDTSSLELSIQKTIEKYFEEKKESEKQILDSLVTVSNELRINNQNLNSKIIEKNNFDKIQLGIQILILLGLIVNIIK